MTYENCSKKIKHKYVKLEEGKVKAVFDNEEGAWYIRTCFDGCVVKQSTAADFVLRKCEVGQLVVELKSTDVNHAVDQIVATVKYLAANGYLIKPFGGLIIGRRWPKFDTKLQRGQNRFLKEFNSPLKLETRYEGLIFEHYIRI